MHRDRQFSPSIKRTDALWLIFASFVTFAIANAAWAIDPDVPGFIVETYAESDGLKPMKLSFDVPGVLFTGREWDDAPGDSLRIHRIGVGGAPVEEYGDHPFIDPDAVLFDGSGIISGTPGSVLVGEQYTSDVQGAIWAIDPDESVRMIFGPTEDFENPSDMTFDSTERLLFTDFPTSGPSAVFESRGENPTPLFALPSQGWEIEVGVMDTIYTSSYDGSIQVHTADGIVVDDELVINLGTRPVLAFSHGVPGWETYLYLIDSGNGGTGKLFRVDSEGDRTEIGTGFGEDCYGMTFGPANGLYVCLRDEDRVIRIIPEATPIEETSWGRIKTRFRE